MAVRTTTADGSANTPPPARWPGRHPLVVGGVLILLLYGGSYAWLRSEHGMLRTEWYHNVYRGSTPSPEAGWRDVVISAPAPEHRWADIVYWPLRHLEAAIRSRTASPPGP